MSRLFFALWPDDQTRNELYRVATQFSDAPVRLVKQSNLHMTLEFLGEVSESDQQGLIDRANKLKAKPFNLELTNIGFWRRPQILFIGVTHVPEPLTRLVSDVRKMVLTQGLQPDKRDYKPHVTIARKAKQLVIPKDNFRIAWRADSFALVVSESGTNGVNYRVLQSWPLS